LKREYGKICCIINIFTTWLWLKYKLNIPALHFGKVSCEWRKSSLTEDILSYDLGSLVRFLEDTWLSERSLDCQYPSSYNIVVRKNVSVQSILSHVPLNIGFQRLLNEAKWDRWMHLCSRLMMVQWNDEPNRFVWSLVYLILSQCIKISWNHIITFPFNTYGSWNPPKDKNIHVVT
jgi:hypothetical protein